jgi:hypothetical protein
LRRAKASAGEVRCQLYVAADLDCVSHGSICDASDLADKASRQIARFIDYLESHPQAKRVREGQSEYEV